MISFSKLCAPLVGSVAMLVVASCGGGGSGVGASNALGSANTLDTGYCADTCPKPCATDNDCMTANGELCCDFGGDGKACTDAKACPRQCEGDSQCDTFEGEACVRVTLESSLEVCASPSVGLSLCKADDDCKGIGDVCCTAYDEPVCLAANLCPKTCATSAECQTGAGELCCETLARVDTTLKAGGICVAASEVPCPVACTQSSDCNTKQGELCCDGLCSTHCEHKCNASSDCSGQICCKTRAAFSPLSGGGKAPGYRRAQGSSSGTAGSSGSSGSTCAGFECDDGTCIAASWRCDGTEDCVTGEDELSCTSGGAAGSGGSDSASCAATGAGTAECTTCCEEAQPTGAAQFVDAISACLCGSGPCATTCASSGFCASPNLNTPDLPASCQTCLSNSCSDTISNVCFSATECLDYLTCTQGC